MWPERFSTISGEYGGASYHKWLVTRQLARIRLLKGVLRGAGPETTAEFL